MSINRTRTRVLDEGEPLNCDSVTAFYSDNRWGRTTDYVTPKYGSYTVPVQPLDPPHLCTFESFEDEISGLGLLSPPEHFLGTPDQLVYRPCNHAVKKNFPLKTVNLDAVILPTHSTKWSTCLLTFGGPPAGLSPQWYRPQLHNSINAIVTNPYIPSNTTLRYGFEKMMADANLLDAADFNVLAFIGELREILSLTNLFKFKYLDDREVSDKFLGYSFGVLPLISDLDNITKLIKHLGPAIEKWQQMAKDGKMLNAHAKFLDEFTTGEYSGPALIVGGASVHTAAIFNTRHQVVNMTKVIGSAYFTPLPLDVDLIDDLKRNIWGFNRPLNAIWQLTPWSFVVDWIVNVGKVIDSFEASTPLLQVNHSSAGYSVRTTTYVVSDTYVSVGDAPEELVHSHYNEYDFYKRFVYDTSVLFTDKVVGPMKWTNKWDTNKTVLSSALLHQRLRS